ncbi:MAG: hypothetical protein ACTS8R_01370 [Arsenophonus sp. NC-QC1-MAG3]
MLRDLAIRTTFISCPMRYIILQGDDRLCLVVALIDSTTHQRKELIQIKDAYRKSEVNCA